MPNDPVFSVTRLSDGGVAVSIEDKTVVLDPASWCKHVASVAAQAETDAKARMELLVQAIHTDDATLRVHLHNLATRFITAGHDVLAGFKAALKDLEAPAPAAPAAKAPDAPAADAAQTAGGTAGAGGAGTATADASKPAA
jgi:hypothetical protein